MRMTTEEAFVKVLQRHGIEHVFGIIGSAFMPISDLFPKAGITFWDVAHESNAGFMCDGYTRATGKIAMCIGQNGPGITNLVTPVKTAYWNHTPLLLVTPQAANKTIGQGGFQEVPQMALFEEMVCYQEEVRDASRMAEVLNRVIENAVRQSAPAQINVPRDLWTREVDIELPPVVHLERAAGGEGSVAEAARLLSEARFPVILSGGGVVIGGAIGECRALAERLDAPVCSGYQHNDSFPGSHPLAVGPLGYNGSKAAMELIARADVVLALGTRLNPFSTLPGYGIDYWPKDAAIIQVELNPDRIGLTKKVTVGICGDLRYGRAAHSFALAVARFGGNLVHIAPRGFQMPDWVLAKIKHLYGQVPKETSRLAQVIGELDVIYVNRLQEERLPADIDPETARSSYLVNADVMRDAKSDAMIMHPLPRVNELSYELDEDPRAAYFEQSANAIPTRMALIASLTGLEELILTQAPTREITGGGKRCRNPN